MKTKTKEITIQINKQKFAEQMETNNTYNWVIQQGVEMLTANKKPGDRMLDFLELTGIITISKS
jgi:hypothetical protein